MRPAEHGELTVADQVIGLYTLADLGWQPGAPVVTLDTLLQGPGLVVPPPQGAEIDDAKIARTLRDALVEQLAGPWSDISRDHVRLFDGMVGQEERAAYRSRADRGPIAWAAVEHDGWICQALTTSDRQLVALVRLLTEADALAGPSQPVRRPLGDVVELLKSLAPAVTIGRDASAEAQPNVFDTVLVAASARVRAGVRGRINADWSPVAGTHPYCYAVRIDAPAPENDGSTDPPAARQS